MDLNEYSQTILRESCIRSPYAPNSEGYPIATHNGVQVRHHRLAYCIANGILLTDIADKIIMHLCDNRSCINPGHLVSGTPAMNMLDKVAKGRCGNVARPGIINGNVKLTEAMVLEIRRRYREQQIDLAAEFGIGQAAVWKILNRKTWKHI